ncbi:hypothetical protein, partial [Klebsiella pneumoniae]|uniref:hypothetical protein n=1 Tax=Klebsiella pneumoniae TaxID=573 RepID=UPI003A8389B4
EIDSVFAKEGPLVEVPYVGPSHEMSYATSTIQKSQVDEFCNILNMNVMKSVTSLNREMYMKGNEYIISRMTHYKVGKSFLSPWITYIDSLWVCD